MTNTEARRITRELRILDSRLAAMQEPCVMAVLTEDDVFGEAYADLIAADRKAIARLREYVKGASKNA